MRQTIRMAHWRITSRRLPRAARLCMPHAAALRREVPAVKVSALTRDERLRVSCDLCAAGVAA